MSLKCASILPIRISSSIINKCSYIFFNSSRGFVTLTNIAVSFSQRSFYPQTGAVTKFQSELA